MGWKENIAKMAKNAVNKLKSGTDNAMLHDPDMGNLGNVLIPKDVNDALFFNRGNNMAGYLDTPTYLRNQVEVAQQADGLYTIRNSGKKAIDIDEIPSFLRKPETPYTDAVKYYSGLEKNAIHNASGYPGKSIKQTALDYVNKGKGYANSATIKTGEFIKNHPVGIIGTGIGAGLIGTTGYMLNSLNDIENQYNTSVGPRSDVTEYDQGMIAVGNKLVDSTGRQVGYIDPKTKQGIIAGKPTGAGGIQQTLLPTGAGDAVISTMLDSVTGGNSQEISNAQIVYPKATADYARDSVNATLQKSTSYNPQVATKQTQLTTPAKQPMQTNVATVAKAAAQRFAKKAWDSNETKKISEATGMPLTTQERVALGREIFGSNDPYRGTTEQNAKLVEVLKNRTMNTMRPNNEPQSRDIKTSDDWTSWL